MQSYTKYRSNENEIVKKIAKLNAGRTMSRIHQATITTLIVNNGTDVVCCKAVSGSNISPSFNIMH